MILKNYILNHVQIMENPGSHSEPCCFCYKHVCFVGMLKTWPLCTCAELNLRVLGEVEKNSFIALPGKVGHRGLPPSKTVCPNPGGFGEKFYSSSSRMGLLIRLGCVPDLHSFNLASGDLLILMSFSGSFKLE